MSVDGTLLAYSVDVTGAERFTIRVRDLATGKNLPDVIDDTAYGATWAGNTHLFYSRADDAWRPYVVCRHRIGTEADADAVVLTEPDERFWVGVDSQPGRRLDPLRRRQQADLGVSSLLSADDPEGTPRVVAPRRQGVEYDVEPAGDRLLIVHNDGAEDFVLARGPAGRHQPRAVATVLPHQPGRPDHSASARTTGTPSSRCGGTG